MHRLHWYRVQQQVDDQTPTFETPATPDMFDDVDDEDKTAYDDLTDQQRQAA